MDGNDDTTAQEGGTAVAEQPVETQATQTTSEAKNLLSGEAAKNPLDAIFQDGILDQLPDSGVKNWLKAQKSGEGLVKGIHGLQKLGSSKGFERPGEDAPEEAQQAFAAKLRELNGVPESADGYELSLPEGWDMDEDGMKTIKEFAFSEGVPPDIVNKFLPLQVELTKKANELATQQHLESEMEKAAKLFGSAEAFDKQAGELRQLADELEYDVEGDMTFRHASAWKMVSEIKDLRGKIAQLTGEDTSVQGDTSPAGRSALESELAAFNDPESDSFKALTNKAHPNNERVSKRYTELIKLMVDTNAIRR